VLTKSVEVLADESDFGESAEDAAERQAIQAALAGSKSMAGDIPPDYAQRVEFKGEWEQEALAKMVAETAQLFMDALSQADSADAVCDMSEKAIDALGTWPARDLSDRELELSYLLDEGTGDLDGEIVGKWKDDTPTKQLFCSIVGWRSPPAGTPSKGKMLPGWGRPVETAVAGCDPRRSMEHVISVEMARRKGHYQPDPAGKPIDPTAIKAIQQQARKHGVTLSESGGLPISSSAAAPLQLLPELEACRARLEKFSEALMREDSMGRDGMYDTLQLVNELLQVTEARIKKIWLCCEMLCQRYAHTGGASLSTRREELQARMALLQHLIASSMPDISSNAVMAMEDMKHFSRMSDLGDDEHDHLPDRRMGNLKASTFTQDASKVLRKWFFDHFSHPYPEKDEKERLCNETGLTAKQLNDWFSNWRKRVWNRGMTGPGAPRTDMKPGGPMPMPGLSGGQ